MTRIERFAEQYRLRVTRDECNDQVIQGRRGQLFDGDQLCLMVTDGAPAKKSRWAAVGGKLWMGDISPNAKGRRVQDVKISGVENVRLAIQMVRVRQKRILPPEELQMRRAIAIKARAALSKRPSQSRPAMPTMPGGTPVTPPPPRDVSTAQQRPRA